MNRVKTISVHWDHAQCCYKIALETANGNTYCGKHQTDSMSELIKFLAHKIFIMETSMRD